MPFLDFLCSCHYSPACCWCFKLPLMAHIQLTAYYVARSSVASRASPWSQSVPSLYSSGLSINCSSFHRNSSRKWFTLCILFTLNKRLLRDAKTYACKCSKSRNSEQVSFWMEESLLLPDSILPDKERDNAIAKAIGAEKKVAFIQLWFLYNCTRRILQILHIPSHSLVIF